MSCLEGLSDYLLSETSGHLANPLTVKLGNGSIFLYQMMQLCFTRASIQKRSHDVCPRVLYTRNMHPHGLRLDHYDGDYVCWAIIFSRQESRMILPKQFMTGMLEYDVIIPDM